MRVVADSHVLVWYLLTPERLSETAIETLGEAEDTDGVVASAASIGDLWYASQKMGASSLVPGAYEDVRQTLLNPETNFEVAPILATTMEHFDRVPHAQLTDPFDRFILATAAQLRLPLVSADRAISAAGVIEVIW